MQIGVDSSRAVDNKRIFVVEPDEVIRSALQFILADENETHEFGDLDRAYAKAIDWRPHLVLLGIGILRDGNEGALAELTTRLPEVKIVLIADAADDPLAQSCLKLGVADIVAKPITIETVRGKVDAVLGRGKPPTGTFIPLTQQMR
jgi:DNA-binding NtrC family response regulator